jgi:hypothetical protein
MKSFCFIIFVCVISTISILAVEGTEVNQTFQINTSVINQTVTVRAGNYFVRSLDCNSNQNWIDSSVISFNYSVDYGFNYSQQIENLTCLMKNLTATCNPILANYNEVFNFYTPYLGCVRNLSTCSEERNGYKAQGVERDKYQTMWTTCIDEKSSTNNSYNLCVVDKNNAVQQWTSYKQQFEDEKSQKYTWAIVAVGLVIGAYYLVDWFKKKGKAHPAAEVNLG